MSRPRLRLRFLVGLAVGCGLLGACTGGSNAVDRSAGGNFRYIGATSKGHTIPMADRKVAGNATAPYLGGSTKFSLDSMRGKVVVLNYWAAWCGSCQTEKPGLERTHQPTSAAGVEFDRQGRVAAVYTGPVQQGDLQPVVTALAREK